MESPLADISAKIRLRENMEHSRLTQAKFLYIKIQCVLQEVRHYIYRYECLREEEKKGRGINDYKLLETMSNVRTWESLLKSR